MWNEILALVVLLVLVYGGVVVLPGAPKLIDALCDRIRHGVQPVGADDLDDEDAEDAAATPAAAKTARTTPTSTKARATT